MLMFVLMCLFCTSASADGLVRITSPAEGATVPPGDVPLWLSFTYTGGSASELVQQLMPVTIMVSDLEGNLIDVKRVSKVGTIYFNDTGGYFTTLTINTEGEYVIAVSCPGAPNDFSFRHIIVSGQGGGEEPVEPGRPSVPDSENPGYWIEMEQDEYTVDLAEDNRILMRFTLTDSTGRNKDWVTYQDWISAESKKIIRYKAIGENKLIDHGTYRSVDDGWIMYRALQPGTVDFYVYVLAEGKSFSERIIKINVIDSSGQGAQAKRLVLPEDLKTIDDEAFANDTSFDEVFVPDGCTSIGSYAFGGCTFMDSIYIPESVTYIADNAFEGTNSLRIYAKAGSYAEEYARDRFRFTAY